MKRKKILIVDVPDVIKTLEAYIDRWGYGPTVTTTNADSIEELITQNDIGLIILAQEMTLKGPSLSEQWKKGEDIDVDFEFGDKVFQRLQKKNINLPIVFFTTENVGKPQRFRNDEGRFHSAIIEKRLHDSNVGELKKMIEECLVATMPMS